MNVLLSLLLLATLLCAVRAEESSLTRCLSTCLCDQAEQTVLCRDATELPSSLPSGFDVLVLQNASVVRLQRDAFRRMDRLRELHISDCPLLHSIDKLAFKGLHKLRRIVIERCPRLRNLTKGAFSGIGNEQGLTIKLNTPIAALQPGVFRHAHNLRELSITGDELHLQRHALAAIHQLDFLTITGVGRLDPDVFVNSTRFYIVRLAASTFSIPARAFASLQHVHQLVIQQSRLPRIEQHAFDDTHTIEAIELSDNSIGQIEAHAFTGVFHIFRLQLSRNAIRHLNSSEALLSNAIQMRFEDNVFSCDCSLKWITAHQIKKLADSNYCDASGNHRTLRNFVRNKCAATSTATPGTKSFRISAVVSAAANYRHRLAAAALVLAYAFVCSGSGTVL